MNKELNNLLIQLKEIMSKSESDNLVEFLEEVIDKKVDQKYIEKLSTNFGWGKAFSTYHFRYVDKVTGENLNIEDIVNRINQLIFIEKDKIETEKPFIKNENDSYSVNIYGVNVFANEDTKETKDYAIKLVKCYLEFHEYQKMQATQIILSNLLKTEKFKNLPSDISRKSIINKLGTPNIYILSNNSGMLEYVNCRLDTVNMVTFEFQSLFRNITNINVE